MALLRRRRALTITETLVAGAILVALVVPMIELFESGLRTTQATLQEVVASNLAAEIIEQVEAIPFDVWRVPGSGSLDFSGPGNLEDGLAVTPQTDYLFHLSPLPRGFKRRLTLSSQVDGVLLVEARIQWLFDDKHTREIFLRRYLSRDSLFPQ